jgi:hypothetical protein
LLAAANEVFIPLICYEYEQFHGCCMAMRISGEVPFAIDIPMLLAT